MPRSVRLAAAIAAIEGLGAISAGVFLLVKTVLERPDSYGRAGFAVLAAGLGGLLLLRMGLGLTRLEGWVRAPLIVAQIVLWPVGYTLAFQAGLPWYGVPILVLGALELYLLLTPQARAAFADR